MRTFAQKLKAAQQTTSAKATIPGRAHFGQSPEVNSILHLRRTIGNQAVQRMLQTHAEELEVGLTGQPGQEHERLQPKRFQRGNLGQSAVPPVVHEVLASPGQPLDPATLAFMEPRFGHDFSGVRVHADTGAAASARAVYARAYTVGQHIVLGAGQPSPESLAGRLVLAHELAHVVQQSHGGPAPEVSPSAPHERDARAAAMAVATGLPSVRIACNTGVGLARQHLSAEERAVVVEHINILKERLEGLKREATRLLEEQGIRVEGGAIWRRGGAVVSPPRAGDVTRALERVASGGGSSRATVEANELLRRMQETQRGLRAAEAELALQGPRQEFAAAKQGARKLERKGTGAAASTTTTATTAGPKTAQTGAKVEEAVQTGAKVKQAVQTGAKRLTTVALKGGSMVKAGATRALRALSHPSLLPGPLDAIFLMVDVAMGYTAAWDIIKRENTQSGFAAGLSSSLLRLSPDEVRAKLERRSAASGTRARFAGAVGLAESSFNRALGEGYRFGNHLPREGRNALRELSGLLARDKSSATIWAMAKALLPTVDRIFEEARKKEEAARERQEFLEREPHGGKL